MTTLKSKTIYSLTVLQIYLDSSFLSMHRNHNTQSMPSFDLHNDLQHTGNSKQNLFLEKFASEYTFEGKFWVRTVSFSYQMAIVEKCDQVLWYGLVTVISCSLSRCPVTNFLFEYSLLLNGKICVN